MKGALLCIVCLAYATISIPEVPFIEPEDTSYNEGEWIKTTLTEAELSQHPECEFWNSTCQYGGESFKNMLKIKYDQKGVDQLFGSNAPLVLKMARTTADTSGDYLFVYFFSNADQRLDKQFGVSFTMKKNVYGEWTGSPKIKNFLKYYWQGPMNGFTTKSYADHKPFPDVPLQLGWVHTGEGENFFVSAKCTAALNKVTDAQTINLQYGLTKGDPTDCWWLEVKMGKQQMIKTNVQAKNKGTNFIQIYEIGDQSQLIYQGSIMPTGTFAKYMPDDLTKDQGKNPEAGWSKMLMINKWDHTTIDKVINQNSMLEGKIPLQKQIKSNVAGGTGADQGAAGSQGNANDLSFVQKFKNPFGNKLEDIQSVTANVDQVNITVTSTTPYWKMQMGDLLPKTINADVTDIARDQMQLKTGFKVGNDHEEFNSILNTIGGEMKSQQGQVGPKPVVLEWQWQETGEQMNTYDAHMISPYDFDKLGSCFWMKFGQWKSSGAVKILGVWGYTGGLSQALQRYPKWKETLQMNGTGKGDKIWAKEITANSQGLVPAVSSDPFASAGTFAAAMFLLNLLF